LAAAEARYVAGIEQEPNDATPFLPERRSLKALREAAGGCRGCHLSRHATQTVFGDDERQRERQAFTDDLRAVAAALSE
jgi:hypothetical protein